MLGKLTTEPDVCDPACLLIVDGAQGSVAGTEPDERAVEEEPSAVLALHELAEDDDSEHEPELESLAGEQGEGSVSVRGDLVPGHLGADHFFEVLISRALDRMPVGVYSTVRERRTAASS